MVFRADGLPVASRVDYWREIISNVWLLAGMREHGIEFLAPPLAR
jgi:hypothetical protein